MFSSKKKEPQDKQAAIQYMGEPGITQSCIRAIERLVQYRERIEKAWILSANGNHAFILTVLPHEVIAIKTGFSSGYPGEGPRGFSHVLSMFLHHWVDIDEYHVDKELLERLDNSALTENDLAKIKALRPKRPKALYDYLIRDVRDPETESPWKGLIPVIPLGIVDVRIVDLATSFWRNPDDALMVGYRRLEDILRHRTGSDEHGSKLISDVFLGKQPKLLWEGVNDGERVGRSSLFVGSFGAYRNRRAHKEMKGKDDELLSEFLLLNHLYRLEAEAKSGA